jgi:hypothetical protein
MSLPQKRGETKNNFSSFLKLLEGANLKTGNKKTSPVLTDDVF